MINDDNKLIFIGTTAVAEKGNVSHSAGPGSVPGWCFSSTVRHMTGKLRRYQSPGIIGHQTSLFKAIPIDFTISSLHFITSFCCRFAKLDKNCFLGRVHTEETRRKQQRNWQATRNLQLLQSRHAVNQLPVSRYFLPA